MLIGVYEYIPTGTCNNFNKTNTIKIGYKTIKTELIEVSDVVNVTTSAVVSNFFSNPRILIFNLILESCLFVVSAPWW